MRVSVKYTDGNGATRNPMENDFPAKDFSIVEGGMLYIQKPNGDNVFFNPRSWYRVDVDNSGQ